MYEHYHNCNRKDFNWRRELKPLITHIGLLEYEIGKMMSGRFTNQQFVRVSQVLKEKILIKTRYNYREISLDQPKLIRTVLMDINFELQLNVRRTGVLPAHYVFRKSTYDPLILEDIYVSPRFPKEIDPRFVNIYDSYGESMAFWMHPFRKKTNKFTSIRAGKYSGMRDKGIQIDQNLKNAFKILQYCWTDDQSLLFILGAPAALDLRCTLRLIEIQYLLLFRFWEKVWLDDFSVFTKPLIAMGYFELADVIAAISEMSAREVHEMHQLATKTYNQLQEEIGRLLDSAVYANHGDGPIPFFKLLYAQHRDFEQIVSSLKLKAEPDISNACEQLESQSAEMLNSLMTQRKEITPLT
ncbi:MAG: hypothetical protein OEM26_05405 [Saprospiraceae bacterium]|nr:hypothetical protein [Saprospiraceae bacterium]